MPDRAASHDGAPLTGQTTGTSEMALLPGGSAAATGPVTAADGRPGPWYRRIDWSSTFWTVFLLIPLTFVIRADMPLSYKVVGVIGLLGFTCAYTWAVSTMPLWLDLPEGAGVLDQLRPAAGRLALLAGVAAASAPGLNGWYTFSYLPYFCAIILFTTTLRTGLIISGCLILLTDLGILLLAPEAGITWAAMGFSLSSVIVMISRFGAGASARREAEGRELAAAAEREEIGRDVHDLLGHSLTVLTLKAEVAHRLVRRDPEAAEHELAEIVELSRSALADVRATVTRLRVPDLAGQLEASRTAFAAADIAAVFSGQASDVPLPQRELLAWALREGTTNVLRHAGATHVRIGLAPGRVRVQDDGAGVAGHRPGNGLTGLRERVEAVGGALVLTSPAPGGTAAHPGTVLEVTL
ncbi:histidine kinase [Actinomyces gerencseriae]|uniref:sensor histidine kinase n=1 Tax=Actinomyces gerencseriae TaxID=52769 RepID=UPI0028ECC701|nr:histidine kinase [Actinomyces gerencseriae]